jgi:hypothetical protein
MSAARDDGDWIGIRRSDLSLAEEAGVLKCLLRGHQPHLHALFETHFAVFGQKLVDVKAGDFPSVADWIVLGIEFAERFDPIDAAVPRANSLP